MVAIDMEMPRWCGECPMCIEETIEGNTSTYCSILNQNITWNGNRVDDCPLVEIITCKNCRYWKFNENASILCGYCSQFETETGEDFYCGDAERREDDSN